MPDKITYVHEPDDLQCGQAVLAMLTKTDVFQVAEDLNNKKETNLKEMKNYLRNHGFIIADERKEAKEKDDLPQIALLSLETPRCWHWSLFHCGIFYDPEHGVMEDFPEAKRKYYWEIKR